MPKLYIIAGCNGAGKTTASYTVLVAKSSSMPMKLQRAVAVQSRKCGNRSRATDVATYG